MCGIAGIVSVDPREVSAPRLKKMTDAIAHRGPDGEGGWIDPEGRIALGSRRLSVIDLSGAGAQPMHDPSGRYTLVYNGEIYNYIELKKELEARGVSFRSTSDTEVLLAMYEWRGEDCLSSLDGMFAFAIHDARERSLFCARDRFGERPFYYAYAPGRSFLFGSEMKALWAAGFRREVDPGMLYNYLAYGLVLDAGRPERTFFADIHSLEGSHCLRLDLDTLRLEKRRYWDIPRVGGPGEGGRGGGIARGVTRNGGARESGALEEAALKVHELLTRSVTRRLRSDVPVGSSLSGGLDSSIVVQLAAKHLREQGSRLTTFSARFPGFARDEGRYIRLASHAADTDQVDVFPGGKDLPEKIREVMHYQEEPFGSAGILAQFEVMRAAKQHGVTVLLDGQGADEILGGYGHHYPQFIREARRENPRAALNAALSHLRRSVNFRLIQETFKVLSPDLPFLPARYKTARMAWRQALQPLFNRDFYEAGRTPCPVSSPGGGLSELLYNETFVTGLPELLRYADRNANAHSREVRLPYLDHELAAYIFTLPGVWKIHGPWSKYLLRTAFENDLPGEIAWRRVKVGFEPPQRSWMTDAEVAGAVRSSIGLLVDRRILDRRLLRRKPAAHGAYERGDGSWSFLMAAALLG
ncbi:asparagine synthase (glutamine-hydrolyzing) [Dinghuibacter silviterrae]|uniref:asparagine synthase (glutamine-hydrolyzing) n=1 Tax=Dinghuibacter silviterrae TaxID=1539049 RepID=A0A4R8DQ50_9BACT|nr:asparagine synthase (glutamine-hydrolyzing) [Dinghuibacter silviterrae]TDX00029.1 asparagine synthase (glutamine-hydrolysing) [Dinghuibacter silviterrae]